MKLQKVILRTTITICLLLLSTSVFAQTNSLDWINKNLHELNSDSTSTNHDLRFLPKILKGKTVVGLGEASHGTQEFFFQKRRIIKYLVSRERYQLIALEFANTYIEPINTYIQTGKGDLKGMIRAMKLYNSSEIYLLCQWLKVFNESQPQRKKVKIIGFDNERFWSDPFTRDEKMALNFISVYSQEKPKSILWSHNNHLAKDTTMAQYRGMGYYLKKQYRNDYYVIGFDTYSGSVNVLNDGIFESHTFTIPSNTFSELLGRANSKTFFIGFHEPGNPILNTKKYIANFYSDWRGPQVLPMVPVADFDGLIFIRNTTASKKVD